MPLYDGVVVLDEKQVPVIIGLEGDRLRMSSGGAEIGEWARGEYAIDDRGDGIYTITAENESLEFVPTNPSLFAAELGLATVPSLHEAADSSRRDSGPEASSARSFDDSDTPAPKATTVAAFYVLAAGTAFLGLWALFSLIV